MSDESGVEVMSDEWLSENDEWVNDGLSGVIVGDGWVSDGVEWSGWVMSGVGEWVEWVSEWVSGVVVEWMSSNWVWWSREWVVSERVSESEWVMERRVIMIE